MARNGPAHTLADKQTLADTMWKNMLKLSTRWPTEKSVDGSRITELVERSDFILFDLLGKQKAVSFFSQKIKSAFSSVHFSKTIAIHFFYLFFRRN